MILESNVSPILGRGGADIETDETALIGSANPVLDDSSAVATFEDKSTDSLIRIYTVQSGDTLSGIADHFSISVNTLLWANNMKKTDKLTIGETLTILPVSGVEYKIKRGDTIKGIATKFNAEADDIISFNDLGTAITAGDTIIIPGGEITVAAPTPKVTTRTAPVQPKVEAVTTLSVDTSVSSSPKTLGDLSRATKGSGSSDFIRPLPSGVGVKSQGLHDRFAVDLAAPIGTPILAAQAGTVIISKGAGYNGGYGKYIVIEHDGGIQTLYAHMTTTIATVGQQVAQGETIGKVGSTGRSTGPHVHFEVRGATNNCLSSCK